MHPALQTPASAVTCLFTDIEGSTQLWEEYPPSMHGALARHDALLRQTVESHHVHVLNTVGDAFYAVFARAPDVHRDVKAPQSMSGTAASFHATGGTLRQRVIPSD
jgi:class 3 adenylate cyclase